MYVNDTEESDCKIPWKISIRLIFLFLGIAFDQYSYAVTLTKVQTITADKTWFVQIIDKFDVFFFSRKLI